MITYRTRGLPDGTQSDHEFVFIVEDLESPPRLRIPGTQHGPDVCVPDSRDQEQWLHGLGDLLVPYWDCEWTFIGEEAVARFVELIGGTSPD
ncbi:MAG: hypothetical protein KJ698_06305 [Actinobacteria bacterium]|nr:hypothetical protein [Actinomycetota bacterium]